MRKTEWKLKGHTFTLCLNAAALTDIYDRFGTEKDIPDLCIRMMHTAILLSKLFKNYVIQYKLTKELK